MMDTDTEISRTYDVPSAADLEHDRTLLLALNATLAGILHGRLVGAKTRRGHDALEGIRGYLTDALSDLAWGVGEIDEVLREEAA